MAPSQPTGEGGRLALLRRRDDFDLRFHPVLHHRFLHRLMFGVEGFDDVGESSHARGYSAGVWSGGITARRLFFLTVAVTVSALHRVDSFRPQKMLLHSKPAGCVTTAADSNRNEAQEAPNGCQIQSMFS